MLERRTLTIDDLSKGLNTFAPETRVPDGFYVDAQNMYYGTSKNPQTVLGLTPLTTTGVPSGNIVWVEPHTTTAGVTTYLVGTTTGRLYRYTVSGDSWTAVLTGLDTTAAGLRWSHVPFRGALWLSNGIDDILKYGSNDGVTIVPGGAMWDSPGVNQLVANMNPAEDAVWSGGTIYTTDTKEGPQARQLTSVGGPATDSAALTYTVSHDFLTGILGGPNFDANDDFEIWYRRTAGAGATTVRFRFGNAGDTAYFQRTESLNPAGSSWTRLRVARSLFPIVAGAPVWDTIGKFTIFLDTDEQTYQFDWAYWRYDQDVDGPPVGAFIDMYAQQLVVAGIDTDRVLVKYSDVGTPDFFAATNTARFSGGRHVFEKADQITALHSYFDELIVGKVTSTWTFSGTGSNVSTSALPLTIGIDSHRGVMETPWSLHYLYENNIFGARLTSRGLVSTNVSSLLSTLDADNVQNVVGIRSDRTHTMYWGYPNIGDTTNARGLLYDYQLDAWASVFTPAIRYYTRGIVSGTREILAAMYDTHIMRVGVGTDFNGTAITSYITLPWMKPKDAEQDDVVQWLDATVYKRGAATMNIDARFADDPSEFSAASFTTYASLASTQNTDKGFAHLGVTNRWIQLRLRATANRFEVLVPIVIGYTISKSRV